MKNVKVSDKNWEKLFQLRIKSRKKSIDEVIEVLLKNASK